MLPIIYRDRSIFVKELSGGIALIINKKGGIAHFSATVKFIGYYEIFRWLTMVFTAEKYKEIIMSDANVDPCKNFLISLRKIIQAIDQHSFDLKKNFGLTGPQLITLQAVSFYAPISVTQISKVVSLSQASVTDITQRLEKKGYLSRTRSTDDRRKTVIVPTSKGAAMLDALPPILQERFTKRFAELERWEQLMIESAFERVVSMMTAQDFNAASIMNTGEKK